MSIKLVLYSLTSWAGCLEGLVKLLDQQSLFRPQLWGISEPLRNVFSRADYKNMERVWSERKGLLFRQQSPQAWLSLEWWTEVKYPGRLSMEIEVSFFESMENIQAFLDFSTALFDWGDMVYGFAVHQAAYERKNVLPKPIMIGGKLIKVGGTDIRACLPGIYWANFFGCIYVEWFSLDRILDAPCYMHLPLSDKGVLLLTASTPLLHDTEKVQRQEATLRSYLGDDAFFDKFNLMRPCRSPFLVSAAPR